MKKISFGNLFKMFTKIIRKVSTIIPIGFTQKKKKSETSKVRDSLEKYCQGNGLDIGYGGDPIKPNSICIDLRDAYANYRSSPQHLHGDGRRLEWFKNEVLDYVYSSHLLEDFDDVESVLIEWLRVLKKGGNLVLFLPDEQKYRQYCFRKGKTPNVHHKHENFNLEYIKHILKKRNDVKIIHQKSPSHIYSFELVVKKI